MNDIDHAFYIQQTINIASANIDSGGGPFGAIIVNPHGGTYGQVVSSSGNKVVKNCDPTCHAEICAIRKACTKIKSHDLSNHILYSSCKPCPMCLSASIWAGIDNIYYAAENADSIIYDELKNENSTIMKQIKNPNDQLPFEKWRSTTNKIDY